MIQQIKSCRVCSATGIRTFFDMGEQPLANALSRERDAETSVYPLSLSWCPDCNLIQLNHTVEPEMLFSKYVWVTSTSSTAREYAEHFCKLLLQRADFRGRAPYILELASNDGTFLKPFKKQGLKVLGIDPASNIVAVANADGISTECAFFGADIAKKVIAENGTPGIVFARNVLPHVADPHGFVEGLRISMNEDSLLAVEVHYSKIILEELHYDSIYHEHLCYFSLKSLQKLLRTHGIFIYDLAESAISGGSIVVFAGIKEREKSSTLLQYEAAEAECHSNELNRWEHFAQTAYRHRDRFLELLAEAASTCGKVYAWGASARSSTMLNFCGVGIEKIAGIADKSPLKHKLYSPGSRIPILSPEKIMAEKPECMVILAWNFRDEILSELKVRYGFKGRVIVPFPYPPECGTMKEMTGE